jgi:hypothetical protein
MKLKPISYETEVVAMSRQEPLELGPRARAALCQHRDHDPSPQNRERCAAILHVAAGQAPYAVARQGLLKPRAPNTLYAWVQCYRVGGLEALLRYQHGGSRRRRLR